MSFIDTCTQMLISAVKNGSVYKQYCEALEVVNQNPELKKQIDELRVLNYRIQTESEEINLYEAIDHVDERMEELGRIPEVNRFVETELALCKQLQGSSTAIHQGINLDVPELS